MTTLIKNGLVYDGSGQPPKRVDILVVGKKIARLGIFSRSFAMKMIDATGGIVTPGFVDINTDSDHYLSIFSEPYQENFLKQGVTTIIGGNCGVSLAPLLTGSLEPIRFWSEPRAININWRSIKDFLKILEKYNKLGVNFGTLAGHITIRDVLRKESGDLTRREIEALKKLVGRALDDGAFGVSLGLNQAGAENISYEEIKEVARVVADKNRVLAVHLRDNQKKLIPAVNEILELAAVTDVNVEINHFEPLQNFSESYFEALNLIERSSFKSRINFDIYPFSETALPLYQFLPSWCKTGNSLEKMAREIHSHSLRERLLEFFSVFEPQNLIIGSCPTHLSFLMGKSLADFGQNQNLKWPESFLAFMRLTNLKAIIFYKNIDENLIEKFIASPQSIISSNGASLPKGFLNHPRNCETFPKLLKIVKENKFLSLEQAIAKSTSIPAKKYRIPKRGLIKEGYYADLVIFKDYLPSDVLINGRIAVRDGISQKSLSGSILKT
jgi:N-acyl-D-amino-acid deacylase